MVNGLLPNILINQTWVAEIVASAKAAIITVDSRDRIIFFNRAAETMFGCFAAEVTGTKLNRLISPASQDILYQHFEDSGEENSLPPGEVAFKLTVKGFNRAEFEVEATIFKLYQAEETYHTLILRNLTMYYEAEQALKEIAGQLHNAQKATTINKRVDELTHNFRNLLTAILSYSELLTMLIPEDHAWYKDVEIIYHAGQQAAKLVEEFSSVNQVT
jgi:PAS domain S-box-containing protein